MTTNYHTPLSGADEPWGAITMNTRFSALDSAITNNANAITKPLQATTGEGISDRDAIFIDPADGKIYLMDNNAVGKDGLIRGFADGAASVSTTGNMRVQGVMDGFSGLTAGVPVYAGSTAGAITQTRPSPSLAGTQVAVIQMGVALSATEVFIDPKPIQWLMRENMAQNDTLTVQHYPDAGYSRKIWSYYVNSIAGSSLESYGSGNQDTQVALEDRAPATYGADQCTGGTPSASSFDLVGTEADKAYDDNTGTYWKSAGDPGSSPEWNEYDFGSNKTIRRYTITIDLAVSAPTDFKLQYYNGSIWVDADTQASVSWSTDGETKTYDVSASYSAQRWRIYVTNTPGTAKVRIREIEMMETATWNDGADKLSQSFTLASAQDIGSVDLYLRKEGSPTGTVTVRIETDSSGSPSGTLADANAAATFLESSLGAAFAVKAVAFPASFNLSAGTYHIVIDTDRAASDFNWIEWGADGSSPAYAGGEMKSFDGATWNAETKDAIFTVYAASTDHPQRVNVDHWASTHADMVNRYGDGAGATLDTKTHFKCTLAAGFADITVVVELP